jgi:hypothetical protein
MPDVVTTSPAPASAPGAPAGLVRRLGRATLLLAIATVVALGSSVAVLALVFRADYLTEAASATTRLMFQHGAVAALLAASPLFAALLVGYGYMQRAIRRRAAGATGAAAPSREPQA